MPSPPAAVLDLVASARAVLIDIDRDAHHVLASQIANLRAALAAYDAAFPPAPRLCTCGLPSRPDCPHDDRCRLCVRRALGLHPIDTDVSAAVTFVNPEPDDAAETVRELTAAGAVGVTHRRGYQGYDEAVVGTMTLWQCLGLHANGSWVWGDVDRSNADNRYPFAFFVYGAAPEWDHLTPDEKDELDFLVHSQWREYCYRHSVPVPQPATPAPGGGN